MGTDRAPFPPEWVDATLTALAGRMSTRTSPDGIAAAVLAAVVPLIRADEARRIAEKINRQREIVDAEGSARAAYRDAARIAREGSTG